VTMTLKLFFQDRARGKLGTYTAEITGN